MIYGMRFRLGSTSFIKSSTDIHQQVLTPSISIAGDGVVTITSDTEGAAIVYSYDDFANQDTYNPAAKPTITATTLKAKATKEGMLDSEVAAPTEANETLAYLTRVIGATPSGVVEDLTVIDSIIKTLLAEDIYTDLVLGESGDGGLIKRVSGADTFIPKVFDFSTQGNDLLQVEANWQPKLIDNPDGAGKVFNFNGNENFTRDNANVSGMDFGLGEFTVIAWVKYPISGQVDFPGIASKGSASAGFRTYLDRDAERMRASRQNTLDSPSEPMNPFDEIKMLSYVFKDDDGLKIDFYQNTELDGTVATADENATSTEALWIGSVQDRLVSGLAVGNLDGIMIIASALTAAQIKAIFLSTYNKYEVPGLNLETNLVDDTVSLEWSRLHGLEESDFDNFKVFMQYIGGAWEDLEIDTDGYTGNHDLTGAPEGTYNFRIQGYKNSVLVTTSNESVECMPEGAELKSVLMTEEVSGHAMGRMVDVPKPKANIDISGHAMGSLKIEETE